MGEEEGAAEGGGSVEVSSGTFTFEDGGRYIGEYRTEAGKRQRHGKGRFVLGVEEYDGQWEADLMHGVGRYTFSSGASYEGAFHRGEFSGEGTYRWPDGAVYVGNWRNGRMHGQGSYRDGHGVLWSGEYTNGRYISGKTFVDVRNPTESTPMPE